MTKCKKHIFFLIMLIIGVFQIKAQNSNSKNYLFKIDFKEEQFTGKGIDWILSKSDTTQFYLFGEQHGIKGIPELVGDIYEKLNRKSPFLLALEMDEWTTYKIFEKGIESVSTKNPYSIAFDYDSEFKLINKVNNTSEIWGLDQMVTAIHPFQRLVEIAPNENARRLAQGAFLKATLKMGEYLPQSHFEDFDALKKAFGENISTEANQILYHLKKSMEIYVAYRAGVSGEISPQASVKLRESFMKKQFDKYFNKNSKQKAVFKMGGAHIVKGIGPNGVKTLGNYVINKALQNNSNALVVGAFNYNDDLEFVEQDIFKNSDIVLLDCNMYIKSISDSLLNSFSTRNKSLLLGNDAIILFNDFKYAKKSIIKPHQKTFRFNLIKQVSIGAILIIICLSSLIPLLIYYFRKNKKTTAYLLYGRVLTKTFLAFIVLLSVIIFQIKSILSSESKAAILNASSSIWIYIFLCFIALYFVYKSFRFLQTEGKQKHKTYLMLIATSFLLLVGFMYYWNIGGMISF